MNKCPNTTKTANYDIKLKLWLKKSNYDTKLNEIMTTNQLR